jgi:hypothetical protein
VGRMASVAMRCAEAREPDGGVHGGGSGAARGAWHHGDGVIEGEGAGPGHVAHPVLARWPLGASTSLRHGYPWVPTDQAHDRPRQVGLTHQETRQPNNGPNVAPKTFQKIF